MVYNLPQCYMKKTLLLAFALILSVATFAQQQLATLNHENTITVFYGQNALSQAHNAAVNGDIITLSPGIFNAVDITKAVTIRGAGMFPDTAAKTEATILVNNYYIQISEYQDYSLYMEGIYNNSGIVTIRESHNAQFVKCYFMTIDHDKYWVNNNWAYGPEMNSSYIQCIIRNFMHDPYNTRTCAYDTRFVNSAILGLTSAGNPQIKNCVAQLSNTTSSLQNVTVENSILYCANNTTSSNGDIATNYITSFYCIGINTYGSGRVYYQSTPANNHLMNSFAYSDVFETFNGSSSATSFKLKESVATTFLDEDGDQIGMYGGQQPFDPKVRNPLIGKVTVAPQSTSDGKLQVDIELKNNSQQ